MNRNTAGSGGSGGGLGSGGGAEWRSTGQRTASHGHTGRTIVQKFGGSSVANAEKMRNCAARAEAAVKRGDRVAIVVSAMGDSTDDLIALANTVTGGGGTPDKREMDQLMATGEQVSIALMSMTLKAMGLAAVSLTGQQCGMHTDELHTRARIQSVDKSRILAELAQGRIPVVAGFQGVSPNGDVTTLGRGGSDTTAVALAAAIGADECEIYTDVDGVYTTDPRIEPKARPLAMISYDEMMEAASQGAKVMHLRSVELGKKAGVPIRVLHSQRPLDYPNRGTLICNALTTTGDQMEDRQAVSIVALKNDLGRVTLEDLPNRPGIQRDVFEKIAAAGISVDDIIQHEIETSATTLAAPQRSSEFQRGSEGGQGSAMPRCNLVFTLDKSDLADITPIIENVLQVINGGTALQSRARMKIDLGLVKVSAIGVGMQSQPGVAATMFRALADAGITIANITTSEIKISCILPEQDGAKAVRVVHDAFGLAAVAAL